VKPKKPLESLILTVRGRKVLMDADLAEIYGVPTKVFNQAIKRNAERFPEDFCFRLILEEAEDVQRSRSQFVTLKRGQNIKYPTGDNGDSKGRSLRPPRSPVKL
jgi:hypothetical protein